MPTFTIVLKEQGASKTKKKVDGLNSSLKGIGKKAVIAAGGFIALNKVFDGLSASITAAGKFDGVSVGFDNLRKKSGMSAGAFSKFNKALDSTVSSTELMTMANNAMLLGITDSEEQMAKMFDTAQRLAKAVGEDAAFGVNSLVTGIGRQSKLMLDNLGIMVDTQGAYEDYAETIGLTASALDDQQKKTAFTNAALAEAEKLVNKLGAEQLTTTDFINQAKTAMSDLQIIIGQALGPAVETLTNLFVGATTWVGNFIRGLTESPLDTTIRQLKDLGVETEGLMRLEQIQLARTISELNNELKNTGTEYKDIESINKRIESLQKEHNANLHEKGVLEGQGVAQLEQNLETQRKSNNATSLGLDKSGMNLDVVSRIGEADERITTSTERRGAELSDEEQILVDQYKQTLQTLDANKAEEEALRLILDLMIRINSAEASRIQIKKSGEEEVDTGQAEINARQFALQEFEKQLAAKEKLMIDAGVRESEIRRFHAEALAGFNAEQDQLEAERNLTATDNETLKLAEFELSLNDRITKLRKAGVDEVAIEKWKTEQIAKWQKQDLTNRLAVGSQLLGALASLNEQAKGSAKATAGLQMAQAVVNTLSAMNSAIAAPPTGYGPTPLGYAAATAAAIYGTANVVSIAQSMKEMATGGSFITSGPEIIMVGDNPGGREAVNVVPLDATDEPTMGGSPININISGNVMSENYTEDVIIPQIREALSRGEDLGIS